MPTSSMVRLIRTTCPPLASTSLQFGSCCPTSWPNAAKTTSIASVMSQNALANRDSYIVSRSGETNSPTTFPFSAGSVAVSRTEPPTISECNW